MNESRVTVDNETLALPQPFIVLATQNPLEHRGTYPLPESQMDRFMMKLRIGYPDRVEEMMVLQGEDRLTMVSEMNPILSADDILVCQEQVGCVTMDESLVGYIIDIVEHSRKSDYLMLGISPRGALHLKKAAQALAFVRGRTYCIPDDLQELAVPVLSHRIIPKVSTGHRGDASETVEEIISYLLYQVPVPV
jgi:MoxR-like ATPase